MVCFLKPAAYDVDLIGPMTQQTIGQRTTYSLVKENEHGGNFDPFRHGLPLRLNGGPELSDAEIGGSEPRDFPEMYPNHSCPCCS